MHEIIMTIKPLLICVILSTRTHLYCIRSFGSTDRTTGLLSMHCKKGVSSLVL